MKYELGVIGAGNMAEAIVRGVLRAERIAAGRIIASDPTLQRRELFHKELGVHAVEDNREAAAHCSVLLLSVKPQTCREMLAEIADVVPAKTLVISIMAGISSKLIDTSLGGDCRVVRAMPNTPMLVGEGMVAIAPGDHATTKDLETARGLFEAAASVIEVKEDQIDAVTAVSGSGPAYFFFLVEQMIVNGIKLGLSANQATMLANKTAMGAAAMLMKTNEPAHVLRRKVTSPNGTTHAAIRQFETQHLPAIIRDAMEACAERSRELGQ